VVGLNCEKLYLSPTKPCKLGHSNLVLDTRPRLSPTRSVTDRSSCKLSVELHDKNGHITFNIISAIFNDEVSI